MRKNTPPFSQPTNTAKTQAQSTSLMASHNQLVKDNTNGKVVDGAEPKDSDGFYQRPIW